MWETINNTLNGNNALTVLVFILIIVIIISILAKADILKVRTKVVKIGGSDETERAIIRQQFEWATIYVRGLYGKCMSMYPHLDKEICQLVLERILVEIVSWITFNHITRSEMYVFVKTTRIQSIVFSMEVNDSIKSEEFQKKMAEWTKETINNLVNIREYYSKEH